MTIQGDASQKGLGAVLLQANRPAEFASKLLTKTESRYFNIEREILAVLFDLEKYHYYAYGKPVVRNLTTNLLGLSSENTWQVLLPALQG